PARAVRVRREADGGELRRRRPGQRVRQAGRPRRRARVRGRGTGGGGGARVGDGVPGGDGRIRAAAHDGHLVRAHARRAAREVHPGRRGRGGEGGEEGQKGEEE